MERALAHLRADPIAMRARAHNHLALVARKELADPRYLAEWAELIQADPDRIAAATLSDTDHAITLRSMNPFFIPFDERDQIFAAFRARQASSHETTGT